MASYISEPSLKQTFPKENNIILLGETGAGKSTLINYLTNYFNNGTLNNFKIAIPTKYHEATEGLKHHENNVQDGSKSQTRASSIYNFSKEGVIFNFIDTPGLSDTEGVVRDDFNIQQIMNAAEQSGLLTAIILVINGTQSRATVTLRNTLCLLRSSIPDALLQNLVVVLTNCSITSVNFDLAYLKPWTIPEANVFHMNNCALNKPVTKWKNVECMKKFMEREWEDSMDTIEELIQKLKLLCGKATEAFTQMRMKRNRIKSQLHGILLQVQKYQYLQNELDIMKLTQKNIASNIEKYSYYKQTIHVEFTEFVKCDFYHTICSVCSSLCRDHAVKKGANANVFQTVLGTVLNSFPILKIAFNIFNLIASHFSIPLCHCTHPINRHYIDKVRPVKKIKTVEEILEDVKSAYDRSKRKNEEILSKIGNLDTDIAAVKHALDEKEADILKHCYELKKLCSQFNFVDELQAIFDIMERDARTLSSTVARADADNRIKNIKHVVDELSCTGKSG